MLILLNHGICKVISKTLAINNIWILRQLSIAPRRGIEFFLRILWAFVKSLPSFFNPSYHILVGVEQFSLGTLLCTVKHTEHKHICFNDIAFDTLRQQTCTQHYCSQTFYAWRDSVDNHYAIPVMKLEMLVQCLFSKLHYLWLIQTKVFVRFLKWF